ncbi:MAG: excinuclease ABC subunit C [Methanomicrobiales archaeon]|nr:excinuclease ABC subunit C [Methanomicrobiales archaeon]
MIDTTALPRLPGCYLFSDADGTVIYVGKAKNLKNRVSSYFQSRERDAKTDHLVTAAAAVDVIVTENEVEALILENNLIKRYQPRYNIDLKDSKNFAYIHISGEAYPRIGIARKARGGGTFYGPFVSAKERDYVLEVLKKTFRLRTCRKMPKRACLRMHIGTCSAPCENRIGREAYAEAVARAAAVLKGQGSDLVRTLEAEMATRAEREEFEAAMLLRDQIGAIRHLTERQRVDRRVAHDEDIVNWTERDGKVYLMLFHVERGTLAEKQEFVFEAGEGVIEEFIVQYYAENAPPAEIVLPEPAGEDVAAYLSRLRGKKVTVTVPQRGDKKKLLDLVAKNIEIGFFGDLLKQEALRKAVGLPDIPAVIECFDISHLAGTAMVGSMVQFRQGRPDKRNYRRFRIRTIEGIDDTAAIAEVVRRRYTRLRDEDSPMPDLVIIDGGKGQLRAARDALMAIGVKVPVIAIAKREEEIYLPGMTHALPLGKKQKASLFIQEIRDEAHRFALAYNRLLRKKQVIQ